MAGSRVTEPAANPIPDSQARELVVRLRPPEMNLNKDQVAGQVASIELETLAKRFESSGEVITEFYGRLVSEDPSSKESLISVPKPSLNEGNHLSYALQWIIFGLMAFFAFFWAYRNEKRIELERQGLLQPKIRRKTQADFDAQIEDANQ